jgi:hypothetical protein
MDCQESSALQRNVLVSQRKVDWELFRYTKTCTGEREAQNETPFISLTDMCSIAHTFAEKLIKYTTLCCHLIGQICKSNHSK